MVMLGVRIRVEISCNYMATKNGKIVGGGGNELHKCHIKKMFANFFYV